MKLSERAEALLGVVREATIWNDGKLERYWLAFNGCNPYSVYGEDFEGRVYGAGDMSALRGLERKGLIAATRGAAGLAFYATEDGCVLYEKIAERRGMYNSTSACARETVFKINGGRR